MTLAGERWVAPSHEASNERLVRRHLLVGAAAVAGLISRKTPDATPEAGREASEPGPVEELPIRAVLGSGWVELSWAP